MVFVPKFNQKSRIWPIGALKLIFSVVFSFSAGDGLGFFGSLVYLVPIRESGQVTIKAMGQL